MLQKCSLFAGIDYIGHVIRSGWLDILSAAASAIKELKNRPTKQSFCLLLGYVTFSSLCIKIQPWCSPFQQETLQARGDTLQNISGSRINCSRTSECRTFEPPSTCPFTSRQPFYHGKPCIRHATAMCSTVKTTRWNHATDTVLVKDRGGNLKESSSYTWRVCCSCVGYPPFPPSIIRDLFNRQNGSRSTYVATQSGGNHWRTCP